MKLTSLARTKADNKEREKDCKVSPCGGDTFGYGTRLRFDKDDLKKLGMKVSGFEVGDVFEVEAIAEVISISQNKGSEGYDSASVELQITKIALEKEDELDSVIDAAIKEANE